MAFRTNKMPVLQEKSASGSVASFNTALAMPLASCNIAVNAWQEGSGDPSPSNVRAIHGFDKVNVTRSGKNLIINSNDEFTLSHPQFHTYNLGVTIKKNTQITISFNCEMPSNLKLNIYNSSGSVNLANSSVESNTVTFIASQDISAFRLYVFDAVNLAFSEAQLEVGSYATPYEPYVTPTIYTKQLNGTRAKGNIDLSSGLMKLSQVFFEFDGSENWKTNAGSNGVYLTMDRGSFFYKNVVMCNLYKPKGYGASSDLPNYGICFNANTENILVKDSEHLTAELFKQFISEHHLQVVCDLYYGVPDIEVQLTPTQIETLIGNNTIFADTGDIDLTYKDLDIAKRGNFREVFKLPS